MAKQEYIVIIASAWCNEQGVGINYGWDGERFKDRKEAIRHGFESRGSDDFNIGVVSGNRLLSFDWMEHPVGGTDDDDMEEVAKAIFLTFKRAK